MAIVAYVGMSRAALYDTAEYLLVLFEVVEVGGRG